jgi:hypothetical protein
LSIEGFWPSPAAKNNSDGEVSESESREREREKVNREGAILARKITEREKGRNVERERRRNRG